MLISLVICILGMPLLISWLKRRGIGQYIREDGPRAHMTKEGTPTMGGILIVISVMTGFLLMAVKLHAGTGFGLGLVMICCGLLGFADDFTKLRYARSLGLKARTKLLWQLAISLALAYLAVNRFGVDTRLYFFRSDMVLCDLGPFYYPLVFLMIVGASNALNLTDGLDGLAAGSTILVMSAYVLISFTQFRNHQFLYHHVQGSLDIAVFSGAVMGGCIGFLWWNAPPARIFMGDTGSLALGASLAAVAILSKTELLLLVLGGLFVLEALSVILQVAFFKITGRRVLRMAPLHHHFELKGWSEVTTLVRLWIVAGFFVGIGFIIFYINYVGTI
jgi:phospho-N-acetylmuramoyl-pentapeptide-transferase